MQQGQGQQAASGVMRTPDRQCSEPELPFSEETTDDSHVPQQEDLWTPLRQSLRLPLTLSEEKRALIEKINNQPVPVKNVFVHFETPHVNRNPKRRSTPGRVEMSKMCICDEDEFDEEKEAALVDSRVTPLIEDNRSQDIWRDGENDAESSLMAASSTFVLPRHGDNLRMFVNEANQSEVSQVGGETDNPPEADNENNRSQNIGVGPENGVQSSVLAASASSTQSGMPNTPQASPRDHCVTPQDSPGKPQVVELLPYLFGDKRRVLRLAEQV